MGDLFTFAASDLIHYLQIHPRILVGPRFQVQEWLSALRSVVLRSGACAFSTAGKTTRSGSEIDVSEARMGNK